MTIATWMPFTNETLENAHFLQEIIAITLAKSGAPEGTRYRKVWDRGYFQALEDIRSGYLVLKDGRFDVGPEWARQFHVG